MHKKLGSYGQWTYRGAWLIELVAAAIGLATGLVRGWQAYTGAESATGLDFFLASAPFFMVALAELTKIPIATLLYAANWLWKPFLVGFLLGLAFITFETVFTGLETASALRQLRYQELQEGINIRQIERAGVEQSIKDLSIGAETERAQATIDRLQKQWSDAREHVLAEIARHEQQLVVPPEIDARKRELDSRTADRQRERKELIEQQDKEIEREQRSFESQRESYVRRIDDAQRNRDLDSARRWEQELRALRSPRRAIEEKYGPRLEQLDQEITSLKTQLGDLLMQSPTSRDPEFERRRRELNDELRRLDAEWGSRLDQARDELRRAQERDANAGPLLDQRRARLDQLGAEIGDLEKERIPMARTDQVRRIAASFYGRNPEDVTNDQASTVALIWFGSLSALAALAGPLTAMVALGLQRIAERGERPHESKLARSLRRLIVKWRFRRKKFVRVEVPVERPVEKLVEVKVPVEKVIKEILYVPVLTDDPDAVRRALSDDLPKDIADLVLIRSAGAPSGSPA